MSQAIQNRCFPQCETGRARDGNSRSISNEPPKPHHSRRVYRNSSSGYRAGTRPVWWKHRSTLWQARLWLGRENGGPVSLGLYRNEREAHAAWLTVAKRLAAIMLTTADPLPLAAWEILIDVSSEKRRTLPRWVYRVGDKFSACARLCGQIHDVGCFETPREAFLALWPIIRPLFPLRRPEPRDVPKSRQLTFVDGID